MDPWIEAAAEPIAARARRELEALVAVSSPSGDRQGAEEAAAVASALLPDEAEVERPDCSSPDHAPDLLARLSGTGSGRLMLLGHLDTVVAHDSHRSLQADGPRLVGAGAIDMKGGVVLALGVLRALAAHRESFAEVALLLVVDEEWRTAPFVHASTFEGWEACLCFEAGQRDAEGREGVVVRRKAAGTLRVRAQGVAAHSGSAPDKGRNALLALADAARAVAGQHNPGGADRLSAVPTILNSGEAFNIVPAEGELLCDLRADRTEAFDTVAAALPAEVGGAELSAELVRVWPGMDSRESTAGLLEGAGRRLGAPIAALQRGGASDASHLAPVIPITVDGLGPRGGRAHAPDEYLQAESLLPRAQIALAVTGELLDIG